MALLSRDKRNPFDIAREAISRVVTPVAQGFQNYNNRVTQTAQANRQAQQVQAQRANQQFSRGVQTAYNFATKAPVISQVGYQIPKQYGTDAANLIAGGLKQTFSRNPTPSTLPFTDINVSGRVAGPIKTALGGLSLTPLGVAGSYAYEGIRGAVQGTPGAGRVNVPVPFYQRGQGFQTVGMPLPEVTAMIAGFALPGGGKGKNLSKIPKGGAKSVLQADKLKTAGNLAEEAWKYKSAEEFIKSQIPVYHGSPVPLKRFSNKKGGVFFTEAYEDATGFAGTPDNVYEGYLNFKKPLVIDAKGAKWDQLNTKYGKTTQEIIGNAQKDGYDGVVFKNVIDNAMDDADVGLPGTISYAYKPQDAFLNESQLTDFYTQATKGVKDAPALSKSSNDPLYNEMFQTVRKAQIEGEATLAPLRKIASDLDAGKISQKQAIALARKIDPEGYKEAPKQLKTIQDLRTEIGQTPTQVQGARPVALKNLRDASRTTQQEPTPLQQMEQARLQKSQKLSSQSAKAVASQKTPSEIQTAKAKEDIPLEVPSFDDIVRSGDIDVKQKVNLIDYIRTPDRVLKKIGLGREAELIRKKYDDYLAELPTNINKITDWSKQVPAESNQKIFRFLDGQNAQLNPQEAKIAGEIKSWLSQWADRLKLPEDKRISHYITHIFEKDFIQKEFDPTLARLIQDKVAGSVYDPFLEQRLGKLGYKEDTWQALDAYVKRATRKVHMDEALEQTKKAAASLEDSQYRYVKTYIDRINLRPTNVDNLVDNTIKSLVGYKFGARPTAQLSRSLRQTVYRGTLGLNLGSALRNLSQGANTYAKLGERYTVTGYAKMLQKMASGDDELQRVGVLRDDFIQDRTLNATKKFWEKTDKALFVFFDAAEKVNRGAAYFGAKSRALAQGKTEEQAIEIAKNLVRDTQFTFGSVDTPVALQSDLVKVFTQLQSFTIKQGEFLGEMAKAKDVAGLVRYSLAGLAYTYTIGQLFGMKPQDLIPTVRFGTPSLNLPSALLDAAQGEDEYGNKLDLEGRARVALKGLTPIIPAGAQLKKTISGVGDALKGYSESAAGRVRYPVEQGIGNLIRGGLFGPSNLPGAREYYDKDKTPLGDKQSQLFKQANEKTSLYKVYEENRKLSKAEDQVKALLKAGKKEEALKFVQENKDIFAKEKVLKDLNKRLDEYEKLSTKVQEDARLTPDQKKKVLKVLGEKADKVAKVYDLYQEKQAPKETPGVQQIRGRIEDRFKIKTQKEIKPVKAPSGTIETPLLKKGTSTKTVLASGKGKPYQAEISKYFGDETENAYRTLTGDGTAPGENRGFDPRAENKNRDGSIDRGLFQINSNTFADFQKRKGALMKKYGITSYDDMYDPEKNAAMAKIIFDEQGWNAWYGSPLRRR